MSKANPGDAGGAIFRVYGLPEGLREAVRARRAALGQSARAFVADAVEHELGPLARELSGLGLSAPPAEGVRPARLPLSAPLLDSLKEAGGRLGLPAGRLLLLCLARAAARKRRRPGAVGATGVGRRPGDGTRGPDGPRRGRKGPQGELAETGVPFEAAATGG